MSAESVQPVQERFDFWDYVLSALFMAIAFAVIGLAVAVVAALVGDIFTAIHYKVWMWWGAGVGAIVGAIIGILSALSDDKAAREGSPG